MTNEQIARLIVDVYNMGKEDGQSIGYETGYGEGYEEAYDRAFRAGVEEGMAQVAQGDDEQEETGGCDCEMCKHPAEYDAGYEAGLGATNPCPDDESKAYRVGYMDAQYDSRKGRFSGEKI